MQSNQFYYTKLIKFLIVVFIIKLFAANLLELGNDEVYYYTYALQPDWNHFDHPPLVGLLIKFTTLNLWWVSDVSMRIGSLLIASIASILIFKLGTNIKNAAAGYYAAIIYQCSVYTGFIAGFFIMPDSIQMLFYLAALYWMLPLIKQEKVNNLKHWLLLGAVIGLAALSKVHGLYLWVGLSIYFLFFQPKIFLNYRYYLSVLVTLIALVPILYWNIQNNFITYAYHSERVTHTHILFDSFLQEFIGEILYQNPVIFTLLILAIIYFFRNRTKLSFTKVHGWLLAMSVPMILLFWCISLFNNTLPHWSGPAYIPLFIFAGIYLSHRPQMSFPKILGVSIGLPLLVLLVGISLSLWAPFNLGSKDKQNFGEYCPTLDISGWNNFGNNFNALYKQDVAQGTMPANAPILVGNWFPGGHILRYVCTKTNQPIIGVGKVTNVHKFAWLNSLQPVVQLKQDAYCIVPSNVPYDVPQELLPYFTSVSQVTIPQIRGGKMVRYFTVYRLKSLKKPLAEFRF